MFSRQKKKKRKRGAVRKTYKAARHHNKVFMKQAQERERERERKVLELLFTSIPLEKNGRCVSNC